MRKPNSLARHLWLMSVGFLAWAVTILIPVWLPGSSRIIWALLPYSGYYAFHPERWRKPMQTINE